MGWESTYSLGTISIAAGASVAVGSGTAWGVLASQANILLLPTLGLSTLVNDVTDDTHLAIPQWGTTPVAGGTPYVLVQFPLASLLAARQLRDLIAKLAEQGVIYSTQGGPPDDTFGDDGDFAEEIVAPFRRWIKISGHYALIGTPFGVSWKGAWNSITTFNANDVAGRNGNAYISKSTNLNKPPEANPADWDLFVGRGDLFTLALFDTDRPATGELIAKLAVPKGMTLTYRAGLGESNASADVAATSTAVFTIRKNGVQFATLTFNASAAGVFACAADTTLLGNSNDVLTIIAPNPRDATLSGVAATLVGYRS